MAVAVKGGMLPFGSSGSNADGRTPVQQQIDRAIFTAADAGLSAYHAGSATYVGAPAVPGVTVVRADAASVLRPGAGGDDDRARGRPGRRRDAGAC